jgi:hypothetical protein
MVAVLPSRIKLLRTAMGADARLVNFVEVANIGPNRALVIPAWHDFIQGHAKGQPVCGIGESIWPGRRPTDVNECLLNEALINFAIEPLTCAL